MELFTIGFPVATTFANLSYCFIGVVLGTLVGMLPGLGALAAVSLLLPVTFYLDPTSALVMLAGTYYGAEYGGSISSILLNLPGTASSAVVCLDGHPMARKGRAGAALMLTALASFFGGICGIILLLTLTPALTRMALAFGAAEYFAVMVFALLIAGTIAHGSPLRGLAMVVLGLMLGCIGQDANSGMPRFTFGLFELWDGVSLVVLAVGLFGVSEVIASVRQQSERGPQQRVTLREMVPTASEWRHSVMPAIRGMGIGSFLGALPGAGPSIASFIAYATEKRVARDPSRFGKGAVEGVVAPEASNNASVQTSFIPSLSLGIPGSASMAILLGALIIQGITPGPLLMTNHPDLFWGLIASFWIGNVMLLILNIPLIGIWVRLLQIPYALLYPAIIALICMGMYSINSSIFDVWLVLVFGLVGYGMRLLQFEPAPLLIGFILGPMVEENFRRAMVLARGDFTVILTDPIAGSMLGLSALFVLFLVVSGLLKGRRRRRLAAAADKA